MSGSKIASTLRVGTGVCRLGTYLVASGDKGVRAIMFGENEVEARGALTREFPAADLIDGNDDYQHVIDMTHDLMEHPGARFELPLDMRGSDFEMAAQLAVRSIPAGKTATLLEITRMIWASPESARYVAELRAKDVFAVAVPWHRVEAGTGFEATYRWGAERMSALRGLEAAI